MGGYPSQGAGGTGSGAVDVIDRTGRLLGIVYGNLNQLQQRHRTQELLVQLRNAGIDIDPREIRNLSFSTDSVDISGSSISISDTPNVNVTDRAARLLGIAYGSQNAQLQQRAVTNELLVQLRNAGIDIDPRDRNWNLSSVTDSVSASISGTPNVNVTDRATRLLGITYGSQGEQLVQDSVVKNLGTIETAHREIHDGQLFNVSVVDSSVDIASPKRILLKTPDTSTRAHVVFEIQTEPGFLFEFFEGTTTTNDGTALSEICHRRASPNVATVVATEDPTVTSDGTLLDTARSGTSTAGGKIGGRIGRGSEFILAQNTKYQFKMTPLSNNTAVSIVTEWYEV